MAYVIVVSSSSSGILECRLDPYLLYWDRESCDKMMEILGAMDTGVGEEFSTFYAAAV